MNRFEDNLNVIHLIKNQTSLEKYTGFGGLNKVMSKNDHNRLKAIVTPEEYQSIIRSFKTAYYTPGSIINFIYAALHQIGFTGGRVLDPACGHGAFIFNMPEAMRNNSVIHAVELDRLTAKIAKAICPYAKILNRGFEHCQYKENTFDLIVGNPPYGGFAVTDHNFPQFNKMAIHHYFVAKSIALLKEGGILAMVLPQYCFDNLHDHPRNFMQKNGALIAAFRLPDCMFANAKVTVDIVFYIKHKINEICYQSTKKIEINGHHLPINEYYIDYPAHILGKLNTCNMYGERIGLTVTAQSTKEEIYQRLHQLVSNFAQIITLKQTPKIDDQAIIKAIEAKIDAIHQSIQEQDDDLEKEWLEAEIIKLKHIKSLCQQKIDDKNSLIQKVQSINENLALMTKKISI